MPEHKNLPQISQQIVEKSQEKRRVFRSGASAVMAGRATLSHQLALGQTAAVADP